MTCAARLTNRLLAFWLALACALLPQALLAKDEGKNLAEVRARVQRGDKVTAKLVPQYSVDWPNAAAWTPDDRFVAMVMTNSRMITVWDVKTGDIVNVLPWPAFDPKAVIEAWTASVDASYRLTVEANIRETDSSFCTALTMSTPLDRSGEWIVKSGEPLGPCLNGGRTEEPVVSHGGKLQIIIKDYPPRIEDRRGKVIRLLEKPEPTMGFGAALSPDGKRLVQVFEPIGLHAQDAKDRISGITVFDLASFKVVARYMVKGYYSKVRWLDDERLLLPGWFPGNNPDGMTPSPTRILAPLDGRELAPPIPARCDTMMLPGGAVFGTVMGGCNFSSAEPEALLRYDPARGWTDFGTEDYSGGPIQALAPTPDGKRMIVVASGGPGKKTVIRAVDPKSGATLASAMLPEHSSYPQLDFAPDSRSVGLRVDLSYYRWDMSAAPLVMVGETELPAASLAGETLSKDGKSWYERIADTSNTPIAAVSIAGGKREVRQLFDNVLAEGAIPGSPLRWTVTALDGLVLWQPGKDGPLANPEVLRTYFLNERNFFAMTPEGRYDTDLGADTDDFRWVVSDATLQSLGPQTFMRNFFEPMLGPQLMACTVTDACAKMLRKVAAVGELNRVLPEVKIARIVKGTKPGTALVDVELRSGINAASPNGRTRSDGYDLRLFRAGSLVSQSPMAGEPDALQFDLGQWRKANRVVPDAKGVARVRFAVRVPSGTAPVEFTAYAFNEDRVKSETAKAVYTPPPGPLAKRRVFVVALGVDAYAEKRLRLNFAAGDAELIGARLAALPGGEATRLLVIADKDANARPKVTRAVVADVFGLLAGTPRAAAVARLKAQGIDASMLDVAGPDDAVVISFSGHGWADPQGNFYLLPAEARWPDETAPPDLSTLVSTADMSRFLRRIDAGEMALVIDACHSAASVASGQFRPGPMGDAGLGQLAFDKRMRILAATQADDVALESSRLGQGLLTYALANEGITADGGMGDENGDGAITLDEWLRYATRRLPSLSSDVRVGKFTGGNAGARGVVFLDGADAQRRVQEPALFDFTGSQSKLVLRRIRP